MTSKSAPVFSMEHFRRPIQTHFGDIWGPPQFTNWLDESLASKENCYIGNWSFLPSLRYTGPDVFKLFADCSVNTMNNFKIGQSKHIIHTNKDGKLIEEGVLTRTGDDEAICYSTWWADHIRRNGDYDVEMEPIDEVKFHLQGPNSLFVLEKLLGREFRDIKFMRNETATIAGIETRILRQGMTGEVGFELQAPTEDGKKLWDAVVEAGQEYDIHEMGGRVGMLNHLEANYPTHTCDYMPAIFDDEGAAYRAELEALDLNYFNLYYALAGSFEADDISAWYRSPIELGWGNRVNFDHEFVGDEALKEEKANPKRKYCALRWNSVDVIDVYASLFRQDDLPEYMEMPIDPRGFTWSDKILKDGKLIGATSQRGYSAWGREMISNAVIDIEFAEPGTEVIVVWGNPGKPQREIRAVVAAAPYKPDRGRVDYKTLPSR